MTPVASPRPRRTAAAVALPLALLMAGCVEESGRVATTGGGDAERGAALIRDKGCGACHRIPGIRGADGLVGPPLDDFGRRVYVAGMLPNTRDGLVRWLLDPQAIVPGNAMPDVGLSETEAQDVARYLHELR
jgi:cytochrome c1